MNRSFLLILLLFSTVVSSAQTKRITVSKDVTGDYSTVQ